jgi:dihydroxy-acid dehydratase
MFELARQSGRRIVEMVWDDLKPRDVMTAGAFHNAVAAVLAVSGSINCVKHCRPPSKPGSTWTSSRSSTRSAGACRC